MKKTYEKPAIEITEFEVEDIMTSSGLTIGDFDEDDFFIQWLNIQ